MDQRSKNETSVITLVPNVIHGDADILQPNSGQKREQLQEDGHYESDNAEREGRDGSRLEKFPSQERQSDDASTAGARAPTAAHDKVNEGVKRRRHYDELMRFKVNS